MLRNIGRDKHLIVAGAVTDQCVVSSVPQSNVTNKTSVMQQRHLLSRTPPSYTLHAAAGVRKGAYSLLARCRLSPGRICTLFTCRLCSSVYGDRRFRQLPPFQAHAIKDAADLNYVVTMVTGECALSFACG